MLQWSAIFLIIALISGALGLFRVEWFASDVAWIMFVAFIIMFLISLVAGRRAPAP